MTRGATCLAGALLLAAPLAGPAGADDGEKFLMARVRLTTEPGLVQGCSRVGTARDDDIKDLRRKIVRMGGKDRKSVV